MRGRSLRNTDEIDCCADAAYPAGETRMACGRAGVAMRAYAEALTPPFRRKGQRREVSRRSFGDTPRYIPTFVTTFRRNVTTYFDFSRILPKDIWSPNKVLHFSELFVTFPDTSVTFRI